MKVLVIGNGPAAISAVEAIRQRDRDCDITIISKENTPAYTPCFLNKYLSGGINKKQLYLREEDFYEKNLIKVILGVSVAGIATDKNAVTLSDGTSLTYENLLIASGSRPIVPDLDGINGEGVFTFKTLSDADEISRHVKGSGGVVVMGAGFIGLEVAEALSQLGIRVTVVEREERVLPKMLDGEVSEILKRHLEGKGIRVLTGKIIDSVRRDSKGKIKGVVLDKSEVVECSILIVAAGVRPNIEMIRNSPVKFINGILVDEQMRTNIPNIYAAGDIAEVEINRIRKVNPIHVNAVKCGHIAGCNIAGSKRILEHHTEDMNVVTLFGLSVLSLGTQSGEKTVVRRDSKGISKFYLNERGHIQGVQLLGDVSKGGVYLSLMNRAIPVADRPHIHFPYTDYGLIFGGIKNSAGVTRSI